MIAPATAPVPAPITAPLAALLQPFFTFAGLCDSDTITGLLYVGAADLRAVVVLRGATYFVVAAIVLASRAAASVCAFHAWNSANSAASADEIGVRLQATMKAAIATINNILFITLIFELSNVVFIN